MVQNTANWLVTRSSPSTTLVRYDDFLFDIVYTYVNGSNEDYMRLKDYWFSLERSILGNDRLQERHSTTSSLSRDNNELCFSLRSIEKYFPSFGGRIYIVTDHIPSWLNTSGSQLRVISTNEIMNNTCLPTFNSHAIEANLHKIPELREFYLYFNDDYILGRSVDIEDFFVNGTCLVIYSDDRMTSNINVTWNIHKKAMLNTNSLLDNSWYNSTESSNQINRYFLPHAPHPIRKSIAQDIWSKKLIEVQHQQSSHRFRDMNDVHPTYLISRFTIEHSNTCVIQRRMKSGCSPTEENFCFQELQNSLRKVLNFFDELYQRWPMPKFLTINDRTSSNYTQQDAIHAEFTRFLKTMFPRKSRFESIDCTL
jgi:hypothetical protein